MSRSVLQASHRVCDPHTSSSGTKPRLACRRKTRKTCLLCYPCLRMLSHNLTWFVQYQSRTPLQQELLVIDLVLDVRCELIWFLIHPIVKVELIFRRDHLLQMQECRLRRPCLHGQELPLKMTACRCKLIYPANYMTNRELSISQNREPRTREV